MSNGYDNNNRGACWAMPPELTRTALRVTAEVGGTEFRGTLIRTGAKPPGPANSLWLQSMANRHEVYCVAIFRKKGGGKKLAGGELTLRNGDQYWVSLFRNDKENPKSPKVDISFQPKEAEPQEYAEEAPPDDEVPF